MISSTLLSSFISYIITLTIAALACTTTWGLLHCFRISHVTLSLCHIALIRDIMSWLVCCFCLSYVTLSHCLVALTHLATTCYLVRCFHLFLGYAVSSLDHVNPCYGIKSCYAALSILSYVMLFSELVHHGFYLWDGGSMSHSIWACDRCERVMVVWSMFWCLVLQVRIGVWAGHRCSSSPVFCSFSCCWSCFVCWLAAWLGAWCHGRFRVFL